MSFSKIHPAVLMLYFISVLIISMFITNPVIQCEAFVGGILFCFILSTSQQRKEDLKFYLPLMILITVTNPIFSHSGETPLFFIGDNAITLEALLYGVNLSAMIVSVMLWCKNYNFIVTNDKFVYLFGKVAPKLSLVLSMSLRFIPILKKQSKKISRAQKVMGLYSSESYLDRVMSSMRSMSALVGWALESAVETSRSMRARGYGLKERISYSNYHFTTRDRIITLLCICFSVVVVVDAILGVTDFNFYPGITEINKSIIAIITYMCFGNLVILPLLMELEERIKWSYYKSKISALNIQNPKKRQ
ncbi:MAG: energy-coupling factor transporter transmembrane component T [Acutalibacteraceae bacterium]|nr:energy-coupling factor transporter transmembrane component T [Acutalibacteraceae bacterium]